MHVKFIWFLLLIVSTADANAQEIIGPINIPPAIKTKVAKPQKADCPELNVARGKFVVGDLGEWGEIELPAQSGFCTADQPFQMTFTLGISSKTGPLQCPSDHFIIEPLAEKLCAFMVRQNASLVSLADRIDLLNQKLEAGVSHTATLNGAVNSSGTLLKNPTHQGKKKY